VAFRKSIVLFKVVDSFIMVERAIYKNVTNSKGLLRV